MRNTFHSANESLRFLSDVPEKYNESDYKDLVHRFYCQTIDSVLMLSLFYQRSRSNEMNQMVGTDVCLKNEREKLFRIAIMNGSEIDN